MIFQSAIAFPGGFSAFRTLWIRLSVFVNVPSFSAKHTPGKIISANSAVSVIKIS
jgi:hypothetical protein